MYTYSVLIVLLVLLFGFMPKMTNKNKMRVKMVTNGYINKLILLSIVVLLMYENITLGLSLLLVLVSPSDLVIFNAFVPHRSGKNTSNNTRRVFYFTFNKLEEGNYYGDYFEKKRREMPPDFERDPNKVYNTQNKYNLANPINY